MATINPENDNNNPSVQNAPPTTGGSGAAGSGTGKGVGAATANQVQQNAAPQQGQGYTDVASYLNANQGGGAQLGNQIAGNLTNQYNATKQGIDTSVANANSQINAGYTPENTQLIQQVAANPTGAASDQGQLSQFQGQLNDTYGGPSNWADFGTQQGNVNQAVQNAGLVNTPGGNNALIQQVENQTEPGHTSQGINQLDTLLYQGDPNAVGAAKAAATPYGTLNDYINSQNTSVGNNITGAQTNAAQASQDALNAFTGQNGTLTNLNNTINTTAANDLTQAQQQQAALKADIGNLYGGVAQNNTQGTVEGYHGVQNPWYNTQNYSVGQLSPQDLQSLGITQDQWNALQGSLQTAGTTAGVGSNFAGSPHHFGANRPTSELDLSQYLQQQDPTQMINASTVATPEQYQQMAAIQQLLGSKTPQGAAINPLNSNLAGTYNPANLNQFQYQNALDASNQLGTAEQQAAQQEANALESGANAQHAASQHTGGFLGGLEQDITHPLTTLGSLVNPIQWGSDIKNLAGGQQLNPTGATQGATSQQALSTAALLAALKNFGPAAGAAGGAGAAGSGGAAATGADLAEAGAAAAHGGEIEEDGTVESYLNKRK